MFYRNNLENKWQTIWVLGSLRLTGLGVAKLSCRTSSQDFPHQGPAGFKVQMVRA